MRDAATLARSLVRLQNTDIIHKQSSYYGTACKVAGFTMVMARPANQKTDGLVCNCKEDSQHKNEFRQQFGP